MPDAYQRSGRGVSAGNSARTSAAPCAIAASLARATGPVRCRSPQSGLITRRSAGTTSSARSDARGDDLDRLHLGALDVDARPARAPGPSRSARSAPGRRRPCGRTPAAAGRPGVEHRREQEVVVALPQRAGVPVAVADVQRPGGRHALGDDVDGLDRQLAPARGSRPGTARPSAAARAPGRGQRARLGVEHPGESPAPARPGPGRRSLRQPPGQRERPGQRELAPGRSVCARVNAQSSASPSGAGLGACRAARSVT